MLNVRAPLFLSVAALLVPVCLSGQNPADLVRGPEGMEPSAYAALALDAERLWAEGDTAGAGTAYQRLTEAYPWDGETWWGLGYVRYVQGQYDSAISALRRAAELGVEPTYRSMPNYLALAYAHAGMADSAIAALHRARSDYRSENLLALLQHRAFDSLRGDSRFQALAGSVDPTVPRAEGWGTDIDFLLGHMREVNPVYSLSSLPDTLERAAERLKQRVPELSDEQVALEIQHLLTLLGHAHNSLFFFVAPNPQSRAQFSQLPVSFWVFPEGLYIHSAREGHEDLIGARVLRFESTPAEAALRATERVAPKENLMELVWRGPDLVRVPEVLRHLGISDGSTCTNLTVLDRTGSNRVVCLAGADLQRRDKLSAPRILGIAPPPLWLSRPDEVFWFERIPQHQLLYVQVNNILNRPTESMEEFGFRLRETLQRQPKTRNLVLDLRRNNGGNTYWYQSLLRTLVAFDAQEDTRLFILAGRNTYSAASNLIADIGRLTDAVFVGEPSGGKPLMVGGDQYNFTLPYSRLTGSLSSSTWALTGPRDTRLWIAPDVPVALTADDYFKNRDPVLETVLRMIHDEVGVS